MQVLGNKNDVPGALTSDQLVTALRLKVRSSFPLFRFKLMQGANKVFHEAGAGWVNGTVYMLLCLHLCLGSRCVPCC